MFKRLVVVVLIVVFTLGNSSVTTFSDSPALRDTSPRSKTLPSRIDLSGANTRQVEAFYANPIVLSWATDFNVANYKFIAKGSKGARVKDTILPIECSETTCDIAFQFPKKAQKYTIVVKGKDAAGTLVYKTNRLELKTSKPEKALLIEEVINSSTSVDFFFQPTVWATAYQLTVVLPSGQVFKGDKFPVDEICGQFECGISLTASPSFASGNYSWRIAAIGDFGKSNSVANSFFMP